MGDGTQISKHSDAWRQLMTENLEWLLRQPRTLERDHIEVMLRCEITPPSEGDGIDQEKAISSLAVLVLQGWQRCRDASNGRFSGSYSKSLITADGEFELSYGPKQTPLFVETAETLAIPDGDYEDPPELTPEFLEADDIEASMPITTGMMPHREYCPQCGSYTETAMGRTTCMKAECDFESMSSAPGKWQNCTCPLSFDDLKRIASEAINMDCDDEDDFGEFEIRARAVLAEFDTQIANGLTTIAALTAERDQARDALQSIADQCNCTCHEGWTSRGMHDSECRFHLQEEALAALAAKGGVGQ